MTAPYRWLRAAHKIAPNGARFHGISCYRLGGKEGSRPLPTNCRKTGNYRLNACFRQVCRGRIDASRAVYPLYRIIGTAATGGIVAVPTSQPIIFIITASAKIAAKCADRRHRIFRGGTGSPARCRAWRRRTQGVRRSACRQGGRHRWRVLLRSYE